MRATDDGRWGRFTAAAAAAWLVVGVFEFTLWLTLTHPFPRPALGELALGVASFWGLAAVLTPALTWVARRAPFEAGRRGRAALVHVVALLLFIVVQGTLRRALFLAASPPTERPHGLAGFLTKLPPLLVKEMGGAVLVFVGVMGAAHMWRYYQRYRERERAAATLELEQARLRASLSEARLEVLQMQLQPHFLFNALHAISTLILKNDTRAANEMLSHLSRFLRMTLDHAESPVVPLAVELDSLDAYLRIQRERFRDRLHVTLAVDDRALAAAVPNLVFQPLVENSIRHGIDAGAGAGTIVVRAAPADGRLVLEVEDDGRGPVEGEAGNGGVGLRNVRQRLEQLYPGEHELSLGPRPGGGTRVRIVIPFRTAERPAAAPEA